MFKRLQIWAKALKREILALYLACRDSRTPWYARLVAAAVVAYAFSPIDLVPDFIPVLGYLDDLVLLPLGIALAVRLIPRFVLLESRARAATLAAKPISRIGAALIVCIWLAFATLCGVWLWRRFAF